MPTLRLLRQMGYCGPGYIGYYVNEANAHYNSLQATLEKRFSRGLAVEFQLCVVERDRCSQWWLLRDRPTCELGAL